MYMHIAIYIARSERASDGGSYQSVERLPRGRRGGSGIVGPHGALARNQSHLARFTVGLSKVVSRRHGRDAASVA
jgi:hypothetical protein